MRYLLIFICLLLVSCNGFTTKEEVYLPNYTPELSVFGIISNNNSQKFVVVERTMQLNESYEIDREKLVVKDAIVTVSRAADTTELMYKTGINPVSFYDYDEWDYDYVIPGMYIDFNKELTVLPGQTYKLKITVPDGRHTTGQTTVPELPEIYVPQNFSRIKRSDIRNVLVKWNDNDEKTVAYCISFFIKRYAFSHEGQNYPEQWINIYNDENDLYYKSPASLKYVNNEYLNGPKNVVSDTAMIKIVAIDRMLYDYARKNELAALTGTDFNQINGGVGVFGSICVDSVKVIMR
ncbi:MAG TPA: DUF4249 family protein [bacterium]|nr:DUF4249 family protein [bacterium]HPN43026.1 DUF4249 family protein [bacterium]